MGLPVGSNLQKPCVGARRPRRLPWQCSEQCCEDALWWQMQTLARREEVNTPPGIEMGQKPSGASCSRLKGTS